MSFHFKRALPFFAGVCLSAVVSAQVYSPTVLRRGQIDTTDLKAFVEGIYDRADAVTERQKAEAIWRYFLTDGRFVKPGFWYHIAGWAYEEPMGEVLDPVKLLNSYGFGLCYQIAPLLEAVFEAGGFPDARVWFLTGHTVTEVFYDGAYHYYDSDMLGYNPVGKGDPRKLPVASVRQIEQDGGIMLGKLKSPTEADKSLVGEPWYPADVKEAAMGGLAELFTTTKDNWLFPHTRFPQGHTMDFVLRPGEKLIRYYDPEDGRLYYLPYKRVAGQISEFPNEVSRWRIRTEDGPHSQRDSRRWATGRIEYRPELTGGNVFEVQSPYVIVDGGVSLRASLKTSSQSLVAETSIDGGREWETAGILRGPYQGIWRAAALVKTRSEHGALTAVSGSYGYFLRLRTVGIEPDSAAMDDVVITTRFQLNPRTLPEITAGLNEMTYRSGPARRRWVIPVQASRLEAFAAKVTDARYVDEKGQGFVLPESGKGGEVLFELSAPDGSSLSGFDAGGRFLELRGGLAPDKLTAETRKTAISSTSGKSPARGSLSWSESPSGPFTVLWEHHPPEWRDGETIDRTLVWPEVDRQLRSLPENTKKIFVRYQFYGMAVDDFRLAVLSPPNSRKGSLEITHVWREGEVERKHVERIADPLSEHRYVVDAANLGVVNRALIFECRR